MILQILKQESNLLLMMKIKIDKKHRNLQLLSKFLWRLSGLDEKPKLFLILLGSCYFQDTSVNISFVFFFLFVSFFLELWKRLLELTSMYYFIQITGTTEATRDNYELSPKRFLQDLFSQKVFDLFISMQLDFITEYLLVNFSINSLLCYP